MSGQTLIPRSSTEEAGLTVEGFTESQAVHDLDHEFSFGLERVLDGVRVLVDSRTPANG